MQNVFGAESADLQQAEIFGLANRYGFTKDERQKQNARSKHFTTKNVPFNSTGPA